MQFYKTVFLFALLASPSWAGAQMFGAPAKPAAPKVEAVAKPEAPSIATTTPAEQKELSAQEVIDQINAQGAGQKPIGMTPEQKAAVKLPLTEQIINDVDKANLKERRDLLKAVEMLDKMSVRRENLKLPKDKQIADEKARVDAKSKRDVQKYMQERLVQPLDRTMNIE